jgi:hypothetical protein
MDYFEAEKITKDAGHYASPDFYRMQFAMSIALGLRDKPIQILHDVEYHGSDEAKALFEEALNRGYIEQKYDSDRDVVFFDVVDVEDTGAPYYFRSHIAMQIAYPSLYWDFYQGEHVWTFSHPKMQALVELCVSCLTNKKHPSDYYGEHELPDDKPKKGRPTVAKEVKVKKKDVGFKKWVDACQEYKQQVKVAWDVYLSACSMRKEMAAKAKQWRDSEMDRLRAEMAHVSKTYDDGMAQYDKAVADAKAAHSDIKVQGAPKREDFE